MSAPYDNGGLATTVTVLMTLIILGVLIGLAMGVLL